MEEEEEKEALAAKVLYWGSVSGSMKKEREREKRERGCVEG